MNRRRDHYAELLELIGERGMIALAERFAGTRLLIPIKMHGDHAIAQAIGLDAACRLSDRLAPDAIQVPLARDLRARHYRAQGMSQAKIATELGMTEGGVLKLLKRGADAPAIAAPAPPPLPLFPDV